MEKIWSEYLTSKFKLIETNEIVLSLISTVEFKYDKKCKALNMYTPKINMSMTFECSNDNDIIIAKKHFSNELSFKILEVFLKKQVIKNFNFWNIKIFKSENSDKELEEIQLKIINDFEYYKNIIYKIKIMNKIKKNSLEDENKYINKINNYEFKGSIYRSNGALM